MILETKKIWIVRLGWLSMVAMNVLTSCSHANAADSGTETETVACADTGKPTEETPTDIIALTELDTFQATARDSALFYAYRSTAIEQQWDTLPLNRLIIRTGEFFLGSPYVGHTLEGNETERLVINLREMDCATFMEQSLALALTMASDDKTFNRFARTLQTLRYRNRKVDGYASRLHYLEDWIYENERRGLLRNVTKETGGSLTPKHINFMTTHTDVYKNLREQRDIDTLKVVERRMSQSDRYVIRRGDITPQVLEKVEDGDIIGFTTDVKGLDCAHVGFARVGDDGVVRFLHCSLSNHKVLLTSRSLTQYMSNKKHFNGILVVRVNGQ